MSNGNILHQLFTRQRVELVSGLVRRELKLMYNRSVLGMGWTLIKPLMRLAVFYVVFGTILNSQVPQFASFVFTGLLAWTWFEGALSEATNSIVAHGGLLRQPGFPAAVLPLISIATGFIHFLISLPVLLVFLLFDGVSMTFALLGLPLLMFAQALFIAGLAYLLSALNVVFRDVQHTLLVVLQMMFYLSGIFYTSELVPESYRTLFELNPMLHLINGYRSIFIQGEMPDVGPIALIIGLSLVLLTIGLRLFHRQRALFVERI